MTFACLEAVPELPPVDEILGYLSQLRRPSMASRLAEADRTGAVLIQPRCGVGRSRG